MKVIKRRRGVGRHDGMTIIPGKALALLVHYVNHQWWQLWPGALHGPGGILNFRRIVIIPPAFRRSGCCSAKAMNEFLVDRPYKGRFIEKSAVQRRVPSRPPVRRNREGPSNPRGPTRAQYESRFANRARNISFSRFVAENAPWTAPKDASPRDAARAGGAWSGPDPLRSGPDANVFA